MTRSSRSRSSYYLGNQLDNPSSNVDDAMLEPDAIAEVYLSVLNQHRSAWSLEVDLRPWKEGF